MVYIKMMYIDGVVGLATVRCLLSESSEFFQINAVIDYEIRSFLFGMSGIMAVGKYSSPSQVESCQDTVDTHLINV